MLCLYELENNKWKQKQYKFKYSQSNTISGTNLLNPLWYLHGQPRWCPYTDFNATTPFQSCYITQLNIVGLRVILYIFIWHISGSPSWLAVSNQPPRPPNSYRFHLRDVIAPSFLQDPFYLLTFAVCSSAYIINGWNFNSRGKSIKLSF